MYYAPKLDRFSSCLLIPGRVSDDRGFVVGDGIIQGLLGDITPAISIAAIRNAASKMPQIGLVDQADYDKAMAEVEAAREEVVRLQAENDQLRATQEHISGLKRAGFQVSKIKGRPAKQEATS